MIIEVKDDGIGFREEDERKINLLLQDESNIDFDGVKQNVLLKNETFGLYSIHKRIQLHYGNEYGLNVISEYGKGTSIILIFPYQ